MRLTVKQRNRTGLFAALVAIFALAVPMALAAEVTREDYVAQIEPICKTNTKANERILAGVEGKVKKGKLKVAAGQFAKAATAFGKAIKQIKAVPQPTADMTKLKKWLGYLEEEKKLLAETGRALKAGNKSRAQTLSVRLTHNANVANNTVLSFEFNYCLIDSSKFT